METGNNRSAVSEGVICPIHQVRPLVNVNSDHISVRCCCDFFTRKYISTIDNKLSGKNLPEVLTDWESDLLMNELQME